MESEAWPTPKRGLSFPSEFLFSVAGCFSWVETTHSLTNPTSFSGGFENEAKGHKTRASLLPLSHLIRFYRVLIFAVLKKKIQKSIPF